MANKTGVVLLALCQLNREIENRDAFLPKATDLKETGQLEQDADVILFGVWPHHVDPSKPAHEYWFYVKKNRNRGVNQWKVEARFNPSRQMVSMTAASDKPNYVDAFDQFKD